MHEARHFRGDHVRKTRNAARVEDETDPFSDVWVGQHAVDQGLADGSRIWAQDEGTFSGDKVKRRVRLRPKPRRIFQRSVSLCAGPHLDAPPTRATGCRPDELRKAVMLFLVFVLAMFRDLRLPGV